LQISTSPGLYPAFNPSTTDYVSRCNASTPITVSVGAPDGTAVSVGFQPWGAGWFNVTVSRAEGQSIVVAVLPPSGPETAYYIRCLPSDFPSWTVQQTAPSQAGGFASMVIALNGIGQVTSSRCTIFNSNGVPIWWSPVVLTLYCTMLPDGNVGWIFNGALEEHALDGSLVQDITPTPPAADAHDFLLLPNGDYVLVDETTRTGVDLSAEGGPASAPVTDPVIEEFQPGNATPVWTWDTLDHIPATQMDPQWYPQYITGASAPYDVFHWNSIEYTGSGFIVSYRHLDAVYDIDQSSGNVVWKLGSYAGRTASQIPQSLTIQNDPVFNGGSHFGGQHDARLNGDGSVSLYDDGTNLGRAPRAVRYTVNTTTMTATLAESVSDPVASASPCCGSARKLAGGDWVIGWGGTNTATEGAPNPDGTQTETFLMQFANTLVYRMVPLPNLDLPALRAGMDQQYANSTTSHAETTPKASTLNF